MAITPTDDFGEWPKSTTALDCGQNIPELALHIQQFAGGETDA
jgi:hypothetical protein